MPDRKKITSLNEGTIRRASGHVRPQNPSVLESQAAALSILNESGSRLWQITDLRKGFEVMLADSMRLMDADKGTIQLLDKEKQVLVMAAHVGFTKDFLDHFKNVPIDDMAACGRAFRAKKQIIVEDTETDELYAPHRAIAKKSEYRSVMSTPLFDKDMAPIGMISTFSREPRRFTAWDQTKMDFYARKGERFIERCQMQEALEKMNASLEKQVAERTNQLVEALRRERQLSELKSRFLSTASHEFRTPLSAILSSISLIEHHYQGDQVEQRRKHIKRIKSSVNDLIDILNDFLSLEKLEQGKLQVKKETLDLHELSISTMDELSDTLKTGQKIQFSYTGRKNITQDAKIIKNIMLNLLSNASKYSEENKSIYLNVEVEKNSVAIQVRDEGIGIPEEDQERLFNRFYRAKNAINIQGTGLGLNIVRKYVELLEGTIGFVSRLNEGSTFTVRFPA